MSLERSQFIRVIFNQTTKCSFFVKRNPIRNTYEKMLLNFYYLRLDKGGIIFLKANLIILGDLGG